jgi:hypothetical protein
MLFYLFDLTYNILSECNPQQLLIILTLSVQLVVQVSHQGFCLIWPVKTVILYVKNAFIKLSKMVEASRCALNVIFQSFKK